MAESSTTSTTAAEIATEPAVEGGGAAKTAGGQTAPHTSGQAPETVVDMSYQDDYEEYNYDQDKFVGGGSGKGRTKKESEQHTNHHDPGGHTRKTTQKLLNSHEHEKEHNLQHSGGLGAGNPKCAGDKH